MIDGREMTVGEIADMLGVTAHALAVRRCKMGGCSYQLIVDMYRNNQLCSRHDKFYRHLVHGKWTTVPEVAEALGVSPNSITNYRSYARRPDGTRPTLEETYEHFKNRKRGGSVARTYWVKGRRLTIAQAAKKYGTTENALRMYMRNHKSTLEAAVRRLEERRAKRAEKEIMGILGF
jgi:predicted transcriptional regulator